MKKITLQEVVSSMLQYQGGEKVTMIGIGPMSKTLIKACMLLGKEKDFPLMFIASRNQVDADELGAFLSSYDTSIQLGEKQLGQDAFRKASNAKEYKKTHPDIGLGYLKLLLAATRQLYVEKIQQLIEK